MSVLSNSDQAIVAQAFRNAADEMQRPAVLFRPAISIDGNKWCALYGDNLQDGVAGFGDSPAEAMAEFDKAWNAKLAPSQEGASEGEDSPAKRGPV